MALDLALKEYNVNVKTQFLILCTDWGIDCKNIIQGRNIFYGRENSYTGKDGKIRNVVNHKISLRAEITLITKHDKNTYEMRVCFVSSRSTVSKYRYLIYSSGRKAFLRKKLRARVS
jgi:hypothetical protein